MSNNYDNWERLVRAVLLKEELRQIALSPSINSSCFSSASSSFRLSSGPTINESFGFNRSLRLAAVNFSAVSNPNDQEIMSPIFYLDKGTGKNCCIVGARGLIILWAGDSKYWKWTEAQTDSRFLEMVELQSVRLLDIRCKIQLGTLPQRNTYAAYLVYKLSNKFKGLESAKATIRFVNDESENDAEKRAHFVHLQPVGDRNRPAAFRSKDGWKEVEIGKFYVGKGDDSTVEARLLENTSSLMKSGLIVGGIEFRPTYKYSMTPLLSKQCGSRIVRA